MSNEFPILREPSDYQLNHSAIAHYVAWLAEHGHGEFSDYQSLHAWSVDDIERFWQTIWDYTGVIASRPYDKVLGDRRMPGAEWFPGARLNFAENLLREALHGDPERIAVSAVSETRDEIRLSYGELLRQVAAFSAFLRDQGVGVGDRVAGYVANAPETLIAMLATTSVGAIWSSASPDFGVNGVHDRFSQIEPKVLVAVNGYGYGGKRLDRTEQVKQLHDRMPSVQSVVVVENLPEAGVPEHAGWISWDSALDAGKGAEPRFEQLPFDHPIYILYSSGTTGKPKCIVHGAGGTLLQHSKELILHGDIKRDDVFFYFTTTGWMMWNWLHSGLLTGCELIEFDGNPGYPDLDVLWKLAERRKMTHFGTSAKYLGGCRNAGLQPGKTHNLDNLRVVFSTGSPLLPEDFDWVYDAVKQDVLLGSIAGGTDIVSCFVGANPWLPIRRGEIQCKMLGMDVKAFNDQGQEVIGERGELVCTQPAPCMPVCFWNDEDGQRYHSAYFDTFDGVWAHGDYVMFNEHGGSVIYGRSDATLNPGGVRIGTAEIYRQLEILEEVADSIVVGQPWDGDVRVVLLLKMNDGFRFSDELAKKIKTRIRENASPRHVPAVIQPVDDIPYTRSGKKVEIAVAKILRGESLDNREAIINPESLDHIAGIEALKPQQAASV